MSYSFSITAGGRGCIGAHRRGGVNSTRFGFAELEYLSWHLVATFTDSEFITRVEAVGCVFTICSVITWARDSHGYVERYTSDLGLGKGVIETRKEELDVLAVSDDHENVDASDASGLSRIKDAFHDGKGKRGTRGGRDEDQGFERLPGWVNTEGACQKSSCNVWSF
jgi:hypothetical protein